MGPSPLPRDTCGGGGSGASADAAKARMNSKRRDAGPIGLVLHVNARAAGAGADAVQQPHSAGGGDGGVNRGTCRRILSRVLRSCSYMVLQAT